MGTYHPLTEYQRYQIYALKKAGHDQQRIAATVSCATYAVCSSRVDGLETTNQFNWRA